MTTLTGVEDALAIIRAAGVALPTERVALRRARGRVLATPIEALRALPPFDNAAMDGFALRWYPEIAAGVVIPVLGEQAAGDGARGQTMGACSILTGARLPDDLDTVVPVEACTVLARDGEGRPLRVALSAVPQQGQFVRYAGEDVAAGQRILEAGTRLGDESLMVLRGIGVAEVEVYCRPRLALACTGRELVDADGAALAPGQIANTSGPYLEALFTEAGAEVVACLTIPDDPTSLAAQLRDWLDAEVDLVVTTGAVSVGRHDFVPDVLRDVGATIRFHKLKMRPGKPLLFATCGRTLMFGLPGNPVSSTVGARFFVDAAIRRLSGLPDAEGVRLPLAADAHKATGLALVQKARTEITAEGRLVVHLLPGQESFKTAPLLAADAWAFLPEAAHSIAAGTMVSVFPLRPGARGILGGLWP